MEHRFIKDFKEGEIVNSVYLVRERALDTTRNGTPYISLEIADRSGIVKGIKWDATMELFDSFDVDDFVSIKARVEIYKKYPQLKLDLLSKVDEDSVDTSLYIPTVDKDIDQMFNLFTSEIRRIKDIYLKALLGNIFTDEEIVARFKRSPAATDFHHPYIGGLLEHTLSCIEMAKWIASEYRDINIELLITGIALHDLGKLEELSCKRSFYYTDEGRLIGHIVMGANLVDKYISKISGFPNDLKNMISHIILSHHGEYEWGSPVRPKCLEAVILHHIDNLDAKINGFQQFVSLYNDPVSRWTKHSKMFGEMLYRSPMVFGSIKNVSTEERRHGKKNLKL